MAEQQFRISVVIDPSKAKSGNQEVQRELEGTSKTADRLRAVLVRTFAVLGATAGVAGSIRLLADFGQQMSTVRAVSNATESEFRALNEEAKRLGITTRFSATEAATAIGLLSKAGFTVQETLKTTSATLALAQAGGVELSTAASIAASSLRGFRLEADQAQRVVDVLALAANRSATGVVEIGEALRFAGPVATGLGVSFEETAASIAALADAGLDASLAGTGLRRILSELESPTKRTSELLSLLGLTSEDVKVSNVGLTNSLEALKRAGVDTGLALEIFGDRGGPAFEVLANSIPKVRSLTDELNKGGGTVRRVADIMDQNLQGALKALTSAFEGLIINIGEAGVSGALEATVRSLANGIRFLADNADNLIGVIKALSIAIGVVFGAKAVFSATAALKSLFGLLAVNPFTGFLVLIGTAIGLMIAFKDRIAGVADQIAEARKETEDAAKAIEASVKVVRELQGKRQEFIFGGAAAAFRETKTAADDLALSTERFKSLLVDLDRVTLASSNGTDRSRIALKELSDALAQGTLDTRTLNIVLRQAPEVADVVARSLGVAREELSGLAAQGKITSETVITAFEAMRTEIERNFQDRLAAVVGNVRATLDFLGVTFESVNVSQRKFTDFSQALAVTVLQSGKDIDTAGRAIGALASALQTGTLGSREFAAVLQELPVAADVIAQKFGVARREVINLAAQGKITSQDVIEAFADVADQLDALLKGTPLDPNAAPAAPKFSAELEEALAKIREPAVTFNTQMRLLNTLLEQGRISVDEFNKAVLEAQAAGPEPFKTQAELLDQVLGPQREFNKQVEALRVLLDQGKISADQFAETMKELARSGPEAFRIQQEILDRILGPQEQFNKQIEALNSLLAKGAINAQQFDEELTRISEQAIEQGTIAGPANRPQVQTREPLDQSLRALAQEETLLNASTSARGASIEALRIELELRRQGVDLSETERAGLVAQIERNASLREQVAVLNEIQGPQQAFLERQTALNVLLAEGKITQQEFNAALRDAKLAALETGTSLEAGLERGLLRVQEEIGNVAELADNALVNAFHGAEGALLEFVQTGKIGFRQLASSILSDIQRIIIRLLILQVLQAITGTAPAAAGGNAAAGILDRSLQHGGPAREGELLLVGEAGPELFVPSTNGEVVPNNELQAIMAPPTFSVPPPVVNVSTVVVSSREEALAALSSADGEKIMVEGIRKNRQAIKRELA